MKNNFDLFCCPVYRIDTNIDNKNFLNYCYDIQKKDKGRILSNNGGYQSNNLNLYDKQLEPLLSKITQSVFVYLNQCGFLLNLNLKISNMWLNINNYKDENTIHFHPNCLFSGVYYIKTPEQCGNIKFYHPAVDLMSYDWLLEYTIPNEKNSHSWMFEAKEGQLFLFPSWLKHSVGSNLNKTENRISVSFNIIVEKNNII